MEEVAGTIKRKQSSGRDDVKSESDDTKEDSKDEEPTNLDRLTSNSVDCRHRNPIAGNEAGARQGEIPYAIVIQPGLAKRFLAWRTFCKWYRCQSSQWR